MANGPAVVVAAAAVTVVAAMPDATPVVEAAPRYHTIHGNAGVVALEERPGQHFDRQYAKWQGR